MYATGSYTFFSLANWCKENGLSGNLGKQISVSNVQHLLQNPFYFGLMRYRREIFEGTHEPLISKELFDKCQEVMQKRGRVQEQKKHHFGFLGLMKCASCGCSITAQYAKGNGGIYTYYRCTKKKGVCQEKYYIQENELAIQIKTFLQKVSLSSHDTEKVLAALEQEQEKAKQEAQVEIEVLKSELAQNEVKLQKLLDVYLDNTLTQQEYAAKKEKMVAEKIRLQEKITDFEQKGMSWLEPAREFVLSLNQAENLLAGNDYPKMTTFLKNIGANHILRNRQFVFAPKIQYEMTAELIEAVSSGLPFLKVSALQESNLQPHP